MINQKVQQYNAAVYLRLSKEDMDSAQKAESNSIVNQKQLILGFLQDKPDIKVVSIRIDDGYTGTNFDRPQFQLMMDVWWSRICPVLGVSTLTPESILIVYFFIMA